MDNTEKKGPVYEDMSEKQLLITQIKLQKKQLAIQKEQYKKVDNISDNVKFFFWCFLISGLLYAFLMAYSNT